MGGWRDEDVSREVDEDEVEEGKEREQERVKV